MGRRLILLLGVVAIMVMVAAGVAWTVPPPDPGYGDDQDNEMAGTAGDDFINGAGGNDDISGGRGNDQLFGDDGDDFIDGGRGDDLLFGGTGAVDEVDGGSGNDFINVADNAPGDAIDCEAGTDEAVKDVGDTSTGCDGNVTSVP